MVGKIPWKRAWQPIPVFLPGEFPWTEKPGWLQHMGSQRVDGTEVTEHSSCSFPSRVPSGCTVGVAAVAEGLGVGSLFVFILSFLRAHSRPHGLQPTRLLRPWDFPGKNTGVGCHRLLRALFWGDINILNYITVMIRQL